MERNNTTIIENVRRFAEKLISIPSIANSPQGLRDVLDIAKMELPGFVVEEFESNGIPSMLIINQNTKTRKFKIILNAHLDVVPAKEYHLLEKEGRFYGRGVYDMKIAAAVLIFLFKDLAKSLDYPLALQLVTDEEIGGFCGTKHQTEQGVRGDFVIAGDISNLKIQNKAKGMLWLKIKTIGKAAHGAYPWTGENALGKLQTILEKLKNLYPDPEEEVWKTTINIAKIETPNLSFNKVPEEATASLDIRFVPEEKETILDTIKSVADLDAQIEVILNEPSQYTDENNLYIKHLKTNIEQVTGKKAAMLQLHGASDVRFYEQIGIPAVCFGPYGGGQHSDEEWVDKEGILIYYQILLDFLYGVNISG
ncbi:MAG TPA: M20/M25/M40 family metallo-hydrolase [Ktedonobacteraceae bacterium]|jgi:succinyl-diaminopimelate desuccinylase